MYKSEQRYINETLLIRNTRTRTHTAFLWLFSRVKNLVCLLTSYWDGVWSGSTMCVHKNFYQRLKNKLLHPTPLKMKMDCGRSRVRSSGPATFFRGYWSWNHFYGHSFPSADSISSVVNYWRNDVHLVLVNRLGSLPRNSMVRLTDHLDMTNVVDWDVKPHKSNI